MTKSFKETMRGNNAKFKQDMQSGKEERRLKMVEIDESTKERKVDKVKLEKKAVETKSFRDIRDDYKRDVAGLKAETKEQWEADKVELAERKANRPTGADRMKNTLVKGFALWLAIPAIVVILLIVLFAGVGLWDWVIGLFS